MPHAVQQAVDEYKKEMDVVSRFLDECTEKAFAKSVKASELYTVYVNWCKQNGEWQMPNTKFAKEIMEKYDKVRRKTGVYYVGMTLTGESTPYSVNIGNGEN